MNEENGETPAFFCSDSIRDAQKAGSKTAVLFAQAVELGVISESTANKLQYIADRRAVQAIGYAYQNYGIDALRRGSRNNLTGLEKIVGPDSPADPGTAHEVVKMMVAERRAKHGG